MCFLQNSFQYNAWYSVLTFCVQDLSACMIGCNSTISFSRSGGYIGVQAIVFYLLFIPKESVLAAQMLH